MLHPSVSQLFLKFITRILDTLASSLDVVNADAGVSESLVWLAVSVRDVIVRVVLCAVVVSKFNESFAIAEMIAGRLCLRGIIAHKVQVKLCLWLFNLFN